MTKVATRPDTDPTVVTGECHLEFELGMGIIIGRIIEEDCSILTILEMYLGEETLEKCSYRGQNYRSGHRNNYRSNYGDDYRNDNFGRGRRRSRER